MISTTALKSVQHCAPIAILVLAAALIPISIAQNPLERYPQNYKAVFDNSQISALRVHYGPHEYVPVHDHSDYPTLFIYLNDSGPVRFTMEGVPPSTMLRPAMEAGAFRYSPGQLERHAVQNLSEKSSEFLRVELKQFPLSGGEAFRQHAPSSLKGNSIAREFSNDQIEVQRVVCKIGPACSIPPAPLPALLVAFSAVRLSVDSGMQNMGLGDLQWIDARHALSISAAGSAPAHLLRILVKSPRRSAPI